MHPRTARTSSAARRSIPKPISKTRHSPTRADTPGTKCRKVSVPGCFRSTATTPETELQILAEQITQTRTRRIPGPAIDGSCHISSPRQPAPQGSIRRPDFARGVSSEQSDHDQKIPGASNHRGRYRLAHGSCRRESVPRPKRKASEILHLLRAARNPCALDLCGPPTLTTPLRAHGLQDRDASGHIIRLVNGVCVHPDNELAVGQMDRLIQSGGNDLPGIVDNSAPGVLP